MAREISYEAYKIIKENGLLSERRFQVYDILYRHGPLTAHEIVSIARKKYPVANQTGFNARLSELKRMGAVIEVGEKLNKVSNCSNYLWDVTKNLPVKLEKLKRTKCQHCNGKGFLEENLNANN